jgi:hypothetical protein
VEWVSGESTVGADVFVVLVCVWCISVVVEEGVCVRDYKAWGCVKLV